MADHPRDQPARRESLTLRIASIPPSCPIAHSTKKKRIYNLLGNFMRYVSPAWLFNGLLPDAPDNRALRLRRQQILAELELTGVTLEYHGETLTKNDIIVLFDELEKENTLVWHQAIGKDEMLLTFLEDIHFDEWAVKDHWVRYRKNPLYEDPAFIQWLSPYYYDSFVFYMEMNCLNASDPDALTALLGVPLLMTSEDQDKAWEATIRLLQHPIDQIRLYDIETASGEHRARIAAWIEESFLQLVRLLPQQHFAAMRDRYAWAIFEACSNICKKDRKYSGLTPLWIQNAVRLAVSPEIRSRIEEGSKSH
jgi:hypothetical protein